MAKRSLNERKILNFVKACRLGALVESCSAKGRVAGVEKKDLMEFNPVNETLGYRYSKTVPTILSFMHLSLRSEALALKGFS